MENFEAKLAQAAAREAQGILGAIGLVVNNKGILTTENETKRNTC
jgi:hypothetical protein